MQLVMMGTGPFAVPTFSSLLDSDWPVRALVTRPTPAPRGRRKQPSNPMRDLAQQRGLRILDPPDLNDEPSRRQLAQLEADLFVVCDYGQILSSQTLAVARLGGINLHGSLLPAYRGAAPVNWAIYDGQTRTGVTVLHMTPKLDAGPSLVERAIDIDPDETAFELEARLAQLGVAPVHEAIRLLEHWDGKTELGTVQDPGLASKAPRLTKQDGNVDWSRSAEQIKNQVRAFKPWPTSYTYLHQTDGGQPKRLILQRVSAVSQSTSGTAPGTIVQADAGQICVATGENILSIDQIQPSGKRAMRVDEFLRGHRVRSGDRFGAG